VHATACWRIGSYAPDHKQENISTIPTLHEHSKFVFMYLNLHIRNAVILNISGYTDKLPIEDLFDGFTTG
jgi:hypothetical protein